MRTEIRSLPLGVSGSLFRTPDPASYEECRQAGVSHVEICFVPEWCDLQREALHEKLLQQKNWADNAGIMLWSIHLPFGDEEDPSCMDETRRIAMTARHIERIRAAEGTGMRKVVLHGSYEPIAPAERQTRIAALRRSLAELGEAAGAQGMQIALECLPRTCIGSTIAETAEIIDGMDDIGLCCDTNHLLYDMTEDFIRTFGSRVVTLHISDYDRVNERHWFPGQGTNDWNAILGALEAVKYTGPALFELAVRDWSKRPTCGQIRKCWDGLVEKYEAAKAAGNDA